MAAVILLLSFLPETEQILDSLYQTFGLPATSAQHELYQTISAGVSSLFFPAAILFIALGLYGLLIRFAERTGKTAKKSLEMGIADGVVSLIFSAGMVMGIQCVRPPLNISMAFMFAGLFVFGLAAPLIGSSLKKEIPTAGSKLKDLLETRVPLVLSSAIE